MDEAVLKIRIESGGEVPAPSPIAEPFAKPQTPIASPGIAPEPIAPPQPNEPIANPQIGSSVPEGEEVATREQTINFRPLPKETPEISPNSPFAEIYEKQTKDILGLMDSIRALDKQIQFAVTDEGQHMAGVMSTLTGHQKELIAQNDLIAKQEQARFLKTDEGISQAQKLVDLQIQIKETDEEISRLTPMMAIPVEVVSSADQYREKAKGIYDDLLKAREQLSFLQTDEGSNQLQEINQWQEEINAINETIAKMTPVAVEAFDTIAEKLDKEILSNRELLETLKEEEEYYRSRSGQIQLQEQLAIQKQIEDSKKRVQDLKTPEEKEPGVVQNILSAGSKAGGIPGSIANLISDALKERAATGAIGRTVVGAGAGALGAQAAGMGGTGTAVAGAVGAAFPPVGIAMAAVGIAVKAIETFGSAVQNTVRIVGDFATAIASPDANPATTIKKVGGAIEGFGEKIPVVGKFIGALGTATSALGSFMTALDGLIERYSQFSPQIAQAQAMNEIRQTFGDIRRAQQLGPQLTRFLNIQGEMQQKFEDIKVKLLLKLMPIANRLMEVAIKVADFFGNFDEKILEIVSKILKMIPLFGIDAGQALSEMAGNLRTIRMLEEEAARLEAMANDPLNVILGTPPGAFA